MQLLMLLFGALVAQGMCPPGASQQLADEFPHGIFRSELIVKLTSGEVVRTSTPYLTGAGHLRMVEFIDDNLGVIEAILFAGETVTLPDGRVYVKDTSSLNSPELKQPYNHNDLKNYAKYTGNSKVVERPRKEGEYYLSGVLNGYDSRTGTRKTDNIKHDILMQELVGMQMQLYSAIENPITTTSAVVALKKAVQKPEFAVILDLVKHDGVDPDRLLKMKQLLSKPKPSKATLQECLTTLKHYFHLGNLGESLSDEEQQRLIQVEHLPHP